MPSNKPLHKQPLAILKASSCSLISHPVILFPFCISAFIQLLVLEILYFAPRYPLNTIFGLIIERIWGKAYLHYPFNLTLLPKLFQYLQIVIYIFIGSFLIAMSIAAIIKVNEGKKTRIKTIAKEAFSKYIHIVFAASCMFMFVFLFFKGYDIIYQRALQIRSTSGKFYLLKQILTTGSPYMYLYFSILATTLMAYVLPIIMIDQKKVFPALWINIKTVFSSLWTTFIIVFIPSMLFVPMLLIKTSLTKGFFSPDFALVIMVLSILITLFIDAVIYTSLSTRYLLKKENE
ncbi:Electron transport complex protein RnfD [hydrothermal vent metagenome]|uniref:Electron transport complex protein RnfD n=1 Tax=hydrothermal vent metagenome TaxID=652676 RepID=A0A3B1DH88_9ZZZZ